jgi:ectoine hydroxylase-related dioxygenase (phytanoyl-CoA dioxygenase family)
VDTSNWAWLTNEERTAWDRDGYLVIEDAVPPDLVKRVCDAIDVAVAPRVAERHNVADILGKDEFFLHLAELPTVLPKILGLLGANVTLNHSHFTVTPPESSDPTKPFRYGWHRDSAVMHIDLSLGPLPLVATKVAFYLTDLLAAGHGATYVMPGSHKVGGPLPDAMLTPQEVDAKPLVFRAGTAVVYDGRLLHSLRSPNTAPTVRKAVFIQYAYRWLAPVDDMTVARYREGCSPERAQLLGFLGGTRALLGNTGRSSKYYPTSDELPLLDIIRRRFGDRADEYMGRPLERFVKRVEALSG